MTKDTKWLLKLISLDDYLIMLISITTLIGEDPFVKHVRYPQSTSQASTDVILMPKVRTFNI